MAETLFGEGAGGGGMLINPVCAVKSLVVRNEMDDDVRAVKSATVEVSWRGLLYCPEQLPALCGQSRYRARRRQSVIGLC